MAHVGLKDVRPERAQGAPVGQNPRQIGLVAHGGNDAGPRRGAAPGEPLHHLGVVAHHRDVDLLVESRDQIGQDALGSAELRGVGVEHEPQPSRRCPRRHDLPVEAQVTGADLGDRRRHRRRRRQWSGDRALPGLDIPRQHIARLRRADGGRELGRVGGDHRRSGRAGEMDQPAVAGADVGQQQRQRQRPQAAAHARWRIRAADRPGRDGPAGRARVAGRRPGAPPSPAGAARADPTAPRRRRANRNPCRRG
jgi:hypothetical protein